MEEDVYSDPWNDPAATLEENPTTMARLARRILDRYQVDAIVDLHQYPNGISCMFGFPTYHRMRQWPQ